MKVIITAAGKGSRFLKQGINIPKYLIKANQKTLLEHSLLSLSSFFQNEFVFIFRDLKDEKEVCKIIRNCVNKKNERINNFSVINIKDLTSGQAETVLKAKEFFKQDDSMLIFNIDTCVLNGNLYIQQKDITNEIDGLIYTTKANGDHWSFAKTLTNSNLVNEVSEKIRISENASIGLYYFKSFADFSFILHEYGKNIIAQYNELYVMPIYQYLINKDKTVIIKDIPYSQFVPLGTPDEVFRFDNNFYLENKNV